MEGVVWITEYTSLFFRCLFIKIYLKHTWNKHSLFAFLPCLPKEDTLITRITLWLLFRVLKSGTFQTNLIVQYQNFVQSTVLFNLAVFPLLMAQEYTIWTCVDLKLSKFLTLLFNLSISFGKPETLFISTCQLVLVNQKHCSYFSQDEDW